MMIPKQNLKLNNLISPKIVTGNRDIGLLKDMKDTNQEKIIEYLNDKIKFLEIENNELRNEIASNTSDKEKTEYYLRLRRSLVEEIEKLQKQRLNDELSYNTELDKMRQEVSYLNECLDKEKVERALMSTATKPEEDLFSTQNTVGRSPLPKKGKYKFFQDGFDAMSNFSDEIREPTNAFLSSGNDISKSKTREKEGLYNHLYTTTHKNFIEDINVINSNSNSYLPIINELEDRIRQYEGFIGEKDTLIEELRDVKREEQAKINKQIEDLKRNADTWKAKYVALLGANKALSDEYLKNFNKATEDYKNTMNKTIYDLEKKTLQLEKHCQKYEEDIKSLIRMHTDVENKKTDENENIKSNMAIVIENYTSLHKSYEENIKTLTTQLEAMKQLYISRENEFVKLTNYYNDAIRNYSKPLINLNNKESVAYIQQAFVDQAKEIEHLRQSLENAICEYSKMQNEFINTRPKMRQRVEEAMSQCEKIITKLSADHNSLEAKLDYLYEFMNFFDQKFVFFNTLIEDKKQMEMKYDLIDCQLKMMDIDGKNEEIAKLKETVSKMTKDIELKSSLIRDYEGLIGKVSEHQNNPKRKPKMVSEEVVMKLKSEIAMLANQLLNLSQTKDEIHRFYQVELEGCMVIIRQKNEKIDELGTIIRRMENDISGKKETIFNLWMLEFKEFKDKLLTMTDIKSIIERFKIEGEELNIYKETMQDEELVLLREEIKVKDQIWRESQKNNESERGKLIELVNGYKKNIKAKLDILDKISTTKESELESIIKHRESSNNIDLNKKLVSLSFNLDV
jgi:DNA repair exonuclease SbcCD ATPase subunit